MAVGLSDAAPSHGAKHSDSVPHLPPEELPDGLGIVEVYGPHGRIGVHSVPCRVQALTKLRILTSQQLLSKSPHKIERRPVDKQVARIEIVDIAGGAAEVEVVPSSLDPLRIGRQVDHMPGRGSARRLDVVDRCIKVVLPNRAVGVRGS